MCSHIRRNNSKINLRHISREKYLFIGFNEFIFVQQRTTLWRFVSLSLSLSYTPLNPHFGWKPLFFPPTSHCSTQCWSFVRRRNLPINTVGKWRERGEHLQRPLIMNLYFKIVESVDRTLLLIAKHFFEML